MQRVDPIDVSFAALLAQYPEGAEQIKETVSLKRWARIKRLVKVVQPAVDSWTPHK